MAGGGFARLPDGSVIVALSVPRPSVSARDARDARDAPEVREARGTRERCGVRGADRAGGAPPAQPAPPSAPGAGPGGSWPWRRWSAYADEARTVRAAAVPPSAGEAGGFGEVPRVRVLVHAANRARALTRLRNLGLRAVYLRGNAEPPTPDEITAVLHHPDGLVWRANLGDDTESWHPIAALLRSPYRPRTAWGML